MNYNIKNEDGLSIKTNEISEIAHIQHKVESSINASCLDTE